jgi:hypothetical protein
MVLKSERFVNNVNGGKCIFGYVSGEILNDELSSVNT